MAKKALVDGRPLSTVDLWYWNHSAAPICGVIAFSSSSFRNDKKLQDSFYRVLKASPLLQTRVEGDGNAAVFRQISSQSDWPSLEILASATSDDDEVATIAHAKKVRADLTNQLLSGAPASFGSSLRLSIVRGPTAAVLAFVVPHHFMDGVAAASFVAKLCLYAKSPRLFWPILDMKTYDKFVPTMEVRTV